MRCHVKTEQAETGSYPVYMCMCVLVVVKDCTRDTKMGCGRKSQCCLALTVN